jgi:hypothetical protein
VSAKAAAGTEGASAFELASRILSAVRWLKTVAGAMAASAGAMVVSDNEACKKHPTECCKHAEVQGGKMCGECIPQDGYVVDAVSSRCEQCTGNAWGGVFKFFFITTMMAVFFDFKARKLNVEEEGGGL